MEKKKKNLPYRLGTWFAVPLANSRYGIGIVTRLSSNGLIIFGYFFGPEREFVPEVEDLKGLKAHNAIWCAQFGALALVKKEWPMIGEASDWRYEEWPLPPLIRLDDEEDPKTRAWKVLYSDNLEIIRDEPCDPALAKKYPPETLYGAGALEDEFTELLGRGSGRSTAKPLGSLVDLWHKEWKCRPRSKEHYDPSSDPKYANGVMVHLKLSDNEFGTKEEFSRIQKLGDELDAFLTDKKVGEFDGDEIGQGEATLFMYGPDADALFSAIQPILKRSPLTKGGWVIKRYGDVGAMDANELRIDL